MCAFPCSAQSVGQSPTSRSAESGFAALTRRLAATSIPVRLTVRRSWIQNTLTTLPAKPVRDLEQDYIIARRGQHRACAAAGAEDAGIRLVRLLAGPDPLQRGARLGLPPQDRGHLERTQAEIPHV